MKYNKTFLNMWLKPKSDEYKQYVTSVYPSAYFKNGFIYDSTNHKITSSRWDNTGIEAEYYAWMWARDIIGEDMLKKLES